MVRFLFIPVVAAFILFANPILSASIDDGFDAYKAGDYSTAFGKLEPLAKQGVGRAQFLVGLLYLAGKGVPQDTEEAAGWFRKAAHQDIPEAQYVLGELYLRSNGAEKSVTSAYFWFSLAAKNNFENAGAIVEKLVHEMTTEQLSEARAMVQVWKPLYQKSGVLGEGLEFQNLQIQRQTQNKVVLLIISGRVSNVSISPQEVPRILIVFRGCDGEEIQHLIFDPRESELGPGEVVQFEERVVPAPIGARDFEVTFYDELKYVSESEANLVERPPLELLEEQLSNVLCEMDADQVIDAAIRGTDVVVTMRSSVIYSGSMSAEISEYAFPTLNKIAEIISTAGDQSYSIEIGERTEEVTNDPSHFELDLSERRAVAMKMLLVKQGIADKRIRTVGDTLNRPDFQNQVMDGARKDNIRSTDRRLVVRIIP